MAVTTIRSVCTEERGQDSEHIEREKHNHSIPCLGRRVRHIRRLVVQLCLHHGAGSAAVHLRRRPAEPAAMWGSFIAALPVPGSEPLEFLSTSTASTWQRT
ncbi:hypothetical protein RHRU231_230063 [Rhodococcus ruber]|uniref:Uncharacterized protein n=1 Tax=Rhodococcus ruber TaxID=1830 RepID=A0A098BG82_9NOCA|nr:hypothetical protein RHRU231_230063 [Rhodococcus ruber]